MQSVTTQVSRCGETVAVSPAATELPSTLLSNGLFKPSSNSSTKRRRSIFGPLLCCFSSQTSAGVSVPQAFVAPPHSSPSTLAASSIITQVEQTTGNSTDAVRVKDANGQCIITVAVDTPDGKPVAENGHAVLLAEPNHNCSQTVSRYLLPDTVQMDSGKKCLVIDLDETLVHSSFKPVNNADFVVPVEIDGTVHQVYVLKRPHVDEFLQKMGELYECVLFTASLAKYADPVADLLDKWGVFRTRLFRESCVLHRGNYVKDLGRLGRDLSQVIIIDNSPASYIFHPDNAVPVNSWFDDMADSELLELCPFFETLSKVDSIYTVLRNGNTQ